jgi:hypothetical protein
MRQERESYRLDQMGKAVVLITTAYPLPTASRPTAEKSSPKSFLENISARSPMWRKAGCLPRQGHGPDRASNRAKGKGSGASNSIERLGAGYFSQTAVANAEQAIRLPRSVPPVKTSDKGASGKLGFGCRQSSRRENFGAFCNSIFGHILTATIFRE